MDRLTVTFISDGGSLVAVDPGAAEANLELERELHPEFVRRARTVEERNELTAELFARVGELYAQDPNDDAVYEPVFERDDDGVEQVVEVRVLHDVFVDARRSTTIVLPRGLAGGAGRISVSATHTRPRERRARRAGGASSRGDPDLDEPPPGGRACAVCGVSLAGRRRQTLTCSKRCRQKLSYRRSLVVSPDTTERSNGNGNGNGNGGVRPLTPLARARLRDLVARARLERVGGYERIERVVRDLDRFLDKRSAAA